MNKMLGFIFIFTSLYLFIGIVDRTGEFDNNYVFFLKKPWFFRSIYYDYIGERDIQDVPKEQLKQYLLYCNANIFNEFPCTVEVQEEVKKYLSESCIKSK